MNSPYSLFPRPTDRPFATKSPRFFCTKSKDLRGKTHACTSVCLTVRCLDFQTHKEVTFCAFEHARLFPVFLFFATFSHALQRCLLFCFCVVLFCFRPHPKFPTQNPDNKRGSLYPSPPSITPAKVSERNVPSRYYSCKAPRE